MTPFIILNSLQFITGLILAMSGFNLLRNAPKWGGFLIGGLITAHIATRTVVLEGALNMFTPLGGFLVGGVAGMLIAQPLYMLLTVIASCALGAVIGMGAGLVVDKGGATDKIIDAIFSFQQLSDIQISMAVVFALLFGILAVKFDDFMAMASTAFMGTLLFMVSLTALFGSTTPLLRNGIFFFFACAGLGMVAIAYQNRNEN